jgi:glyoxylase-like metal-dependent hydrolase (beta-lactamase superfamily II)
MRGTVAAMPLKFNKGAKFRMTSAGKRPMSAATDGEMKMPVEIEQFMCRSDNFGVLVHDPKSGETAIIDAPEEAPILAAMQRTGWTPTMILTTHHHVDHIEANLALK